MNILLVTDLLPTPDRNSADFRFTRLIGMLAARHEIRVVVTSARRQAEKIGEQAVAGYRRALEQLGVRVDDGGLDAALDARRVEVVLFEWHFPALATLDRVRRRQPGARIVIDSVDVVFNCLEAKARVSGSAEDAERARTTREAELGVYRRADLVITVTDADAAILRELVPAVPTVTIPNIHPLEPPVAIAEEHRHRLLFIGSYARPGGETNIDAMRWFCAEVLPRIAAQEPGVVLRIVGGPRVPEIDALASPNVEVLGFVPTTRPYLESSGISVAPLRFGGGMKGKIGEAMSYALPVVTTSTGIEGFGLEPGRDALVGDTPQAFADHVIALLRDRTRRDALRLAGHAFIREHYADAAVAARVHALFDGIHRVPVQRASLAARLIDRCRRAWLRHVGWRLRRPDPG